MEEKIKNLLKTVKGIPVIDDVLPSRENYPCITFHLYQENGLLFGSGDAEETGASCQVDVWYKVKNELIKNKINEIKQVIVNTQYFSYPTKDTYFEKDTKIWHTFYNFEIIETGE